MDREKVINDNAVRGLQSAIEISGALVHLRKEHAKAILALLKEQQAEIERLKGIAKNGNGFIEQCDSRTAQMFRERIEK